MRKLVVLTFMSLDGVMQAPGGPEEDTSGFYKYGGWSVPYWDDVMNSEMGEEMGHPFELLLGRKTYDIFAASWPEIDPRSDINKTRKYVITHRAVPADTDIWKNTVKIDGDVPEEIRRLKNENGPELQVHGSGDVIQLLMKHDLVDEFWLKIYPVTLGGGKRLFSAGTIPAAYRLTAHKVTSKGVIVAKYTRDGELKTGSFA